MLCGQIAVMWSKKNEILEFSIVGLNVLYYWSFLHQVQMIISNVKMWLFSWINQTWELHSLDIVVGAFTFRCEICCSLFLSVSLSCHLVCYYHGLTSCGVYQEFWWGCRERHEEWQVVLMITIHPPPSISPRCKPQLLISSLMSVVVTEHSRKVDQ